MAMIGKSVMKKLIRTNAIRALKKCNAKLIEVPHTKGISSAALIKFQNLNLNNT